MGSGLGAGSSQTMFGSSGEGNFLTKLTTGIAILFMITSLTLAVFSTQKKSSSLIKGTEEQLEDLSLAVIDMGALDVGEPNDGLLEVYTEFEFMEQLRKDLVKMGAEVVSSEISMQPKSTVDLDSKTAQLNLELLDKLDDLDDVHHVYTNGNFPDELSNKGA